MLTYLKIKKKTILPLICLLVYSAIIPIQLSDCVLCIDEDGHVKFEYAVHDCCSDTTCHEADHAGEDHRRDCVDLPIFAAINTETTIVTDAGHLTSPDIVSVNSSFPQEPVVLLITKPTSLLHLPPLIDPTLISLRTVTLLI